MSFITAVQTIDRIKSGWNLGNAFDSFSKEKKQLGIYEYETLWHSPVIKKELLTAVKQAGFGAVRMPVTWNHHIDDVGNIHSEWLARIDEVVGYILDSGMYCIINVHHDSGPGGWLFAEKDNLELNEKRFTGLWKNIAEHFRDYGDNLLFEGFNEMLDSKITWTEPLSSESYDVQNRYNQIFVDTVRATGGNNAERNLVVQTYSGGESEKTLNSFVLPNDTVENHLIAEVHNYDPQGFCWVKALGHTVRDNWGTDEDKAQLDALIARVKGFSERIGVPVIIGECGTMEKNNEEERVKHASYLFGKAYENGIKCFWWDTVGEFDLFDRTDFSMLHPKIIDALTKL